MKTGAIYLVAPKCPVGEGQSALGNDSDGIPIPSIIVCPDPTAGLDGDGTEEAIDNRTDTPNPGQSDTDMDGIGDACDPT